MTDTSQNVHPELAAHAQAFLSAMPTIAALPNLAITAGTYVESGGASFFEGSVTKPTRYKLKISGQNGTRTGETVSFDGVSLSSGTQDVGLLVLEELADAAHDDQDTIARLLQPYDSEGTAWAQAIAGDAQRATRFAGSLNDIELPPDPPHDDRFVMLAYLARHFTYDRDNHTYFAKWSDPDDASRRSYPADVSPVYREKATVEKILDRDRFYCLTVQCGAQRSDGKFPAVETLTTITLIPGDSPRLELVYAAGRVEDEQNNECCFFYGHDGTNIAVPQTARGALGPDIAVMALHRPVGEVVAELAAAGAVAMVGTTAITVSAVVRPGTFAGSAPTLPQGVEYLGGEPDPTPSGIESDPDDADDDPVGDSLQEHLRFFSCPIDRLVELAAHDDIVSLQPVYGSEPGVDQVRVNINHAAYLTDLGVEGGGEDVFVGIVDSGIDGQHPAFAGRIEKVWDQTVATSAAHPAPTGTGNNFGQVFDTDADIQANSTDELGHGTHVAGIAAGAPGAGYTAQGIATRARLLVVKADIANNDRIRRGVAWCFREAGNKPCVVNMSLGNHFNGHDGVDNFALGIRRTYRRPNAAGTGFVNLRRRVVAAISHNHNRQRGHTHVDSIAQNATADLPITVATRPAGGGGTATQAAESIRLFARPLPANVRGCRIDVRVRRGAGAGAAATPWVTFTPSGAPQLAVLGTTVVRIVNGPPPAGDTFGLVFTQHQHVEVQLIQAGGLPAGQFVIEVRNQVASAVEVHAYIPNALTNANPFPSVFFTNATERCLIASPASAFGTVCVGATVNRASWRPQGAPADGSGDITNNEIPRNPATNLPLAPVPAVVGDIAGFTDAGPVRGTTRTIVSMTPGSGVLSARSRNAVLQTAGGQALFGANDIIDANTVQMSGTSMACPVATGVVACLFGNFPNLNFRQVIQRLQRAVPTTLPAGWDTDRFGPGPLDASRIII